MLSPIFVALTALTGSAFASCTADQRLAAAKGVIYAYAQTGPQATYNAFLKLPFGVPDIPGACTTTIYPNGGSGITVATTGQGVVNFGTETRQAFSSVTGKYVDFPKNGTTVIYTNVTLGVQSEVPIPVTFSGQVYLDFNSNCRIYAVRAYAEVPTYIGGEPTWLDQFLPVPETPLIFKRFFRALGTKYRHIEA